MASRLFDLAAASADSNRVTTRESKSVPLLTRPRRFGECTYPRWMGRKGRSAQRAVSMVLEAIYEQDYLPCSYGFRPGRSAHQALNSLQQEIWSKRLYWVLEIDIRKYLERDSYYTQAYEGCAKRSD